jgi:hypothetical protein
MPDTPFHLRELPCPKGARYRVRGLVVSSLLHLAAFGSLLVASIRPWYFATGSTREARVLYVTMTEELPAELPEMETHVVTDVSEVTAAMLQEKIDRLAEEAGQRSDQENLARLDHLAERLNEVSSEPSIDRLAGAFQRLLGTRPRAERPSAEPVAGEFDFDSAQFHDVRREAEDDGTWRYLFVLVDAEGRAMEVEMDAEHGEPIYQTMLRIKENPLLERVYRRIAMPLFDTMLAAVREAAPAGPSTSIAAEPEAAGEP